MKFQAEYRDPDLVRRYLDRLAAETRDRWRIMEVCGGQTHTILRHGLDRLLPSNIELIHGPGCPVCVTPVEQIDRALALAATPTVIFCSFGDMMRVPGSSGDLLSAKAAGADVRMVYSPLDALEVARRNPGREVVFFAVGFETTAPVNALAVWRAAREGLANFSVLCSHVTVPAAIRHLLSQPGVQIDAFLAAGHVCAVMGCGEYHPLAREFRRPIVVTGFEVADILQGALMAVRQLESGRAEVENQYSRIVREEGSAPSLDLMREVFEPVDRPWRGLGVIPASGLALRMEFAAHDAERKFNVGEIHSRESGECLAGLALQGRIKPPECPAFATRCAPDHPLGAPMVSTEGVCAAYYRHHRRGGG